MSRAHGGGEGRGPAGPWGVGPWGVGPAGTAARVLVIEGDPGLRRLVVERLARAGFDVVGQRPALAVADLGALRPDLVVLDLPSETDLEPLATLRRHSDVATIATLPERGEPDVAAVLELGADDAVTKPFSRRELTARAGAVLRRGAGPPNALLAYPGLVIDRSSRLVALGDGSLLALRSREFDLLLHLASAPGRVLSREQILEHVWGSSQAWQGTATVTEHVYRLRRRLGAVGAQCIVTVRSVGYRFCPPGAPAAPPSRQLALPG